MKCRLVFVSCNLHRRLQTFPIAAVTTRFIYPHLVLIIRCFLHELAYFVKWFRPWHQEGKFHCIKCVSVNEHLKHVLNVLIMFELPQDSCHMDDLLANYVSRINSEVSSHGSVNSTVYEITHTLVYAHKDYKFNCFNFLNKLL